VADDDGRSIPEEEEARLAYSPLGWCMTLRVSFRAREGARLNRFRGAEVS
jgi:hypothetical protein